MRTQYRQRRLSRLSDGIGSERRNGRQELHVFRPARSPAARYIGCLQRL